VTPRCEECERLWVLVTDARQPPLRVVNLRRAAWYAELWAAAPHHQITTAWPLEALL